MERRRSLPDRCRSLERMNDEAAGFAVRSNDYQTESTSSRIREEELHLFDGDDHFFNITITLGLDKANAYKDEFYEMLSF